MSWLRKPGIDMQKPSRHSRDRSPKRAFGFEFGRILFPQLINHPRAMQIRMIFVTLGLGAILVGAMVGLFHKANDPADILLIQARELRK